MRLIVIFLLLSFPIASFAQQDSAGSSCIYLKEINISGNRITKDKIILRELSVKSGDCIGRGAIVGKAEESRLRLMNMRLFNDVKVNWTPVSDDTFNMEIVLIDRFPIMPDVNFEFADRNFNVWWKEQNKDMKRLNIGLTLTDNNFRGNREQLSITGQVGYTQKAGFSYARPYIDKLQKHGCGLSVYGLQNREIAYMTDFNKLKFIRSYDNFMLRRIDASVWYTYRPHYASTHTIQLSYHHYWISDTIALLNPNYLGEGRTNEDVLSLTYRYEYNGVDNWNYPLKGYRFIGTFEQRAGLKSSNWQSSFYAHYDRYINPWKKWYLAFVMRARVSFPQKQPYIFQQNMGYDFDYVRGYEYYVLDGSSFALTRATLKRELINFQIHLPIRFFEVIPIRVYGKVFGDAGYGYNSNFPQDRLYNRLLYSTGLGIDIVTFYDIKLRVEYTVNHLNEKGLYLHRNGE